MPCSAGFLYTPVQNLLSYKGHMSFNLSPLFFFLSALHSSSISLQNCPLYETVMANLDCQLDLICNQLRDVPMAWPERAPEGGLGEPGRAWEGIPQKYFLRADHPPEWWCPIYKVVWGITVRSACLHLMLVNDAISKPKSLKGMILSRCSCCFYHRLLSSDLLAFWYGSKTIPEWSFSEYPWLSAPDWGR